MELTYQSLILGANTRWHDGTGTVSYSLLSTELPDYYKNEPRDTDGSGTDDAWFIMNVRGVDLYIPFDFASLGVKTDLALAAMAAWGEVAKINFAPATNGTAGDVAWSAYAYGTEVFYGYGYYPEGTPRSGDILLNNSKPAQAIATYGDDGWDTYVHELGHALGLRHPDEDPNNDNGASNNNNRWTVMSYEPHPTQEGVTGQAQAWPITPMILDIEAIQSLYGANTATRSANTTYFGTALAAGTTERAFGMLDGGRIEANGRPMIMTIWDGGGIDTVDASNQTGVVSIDLNPGAFSTIGGIADNVAIARAVTIAGQVVNLIENAIGGSAADTLIGNAGANRLDGRGGTDTMTGNGGNDTFCVDSTADKAIELAGGGIDNVESTATFSLAGQDLEILTLFGGAPINATGNGLANTLTGNAAANVLDGGGLTDTMTGLDGSDTFYVDSADDKVIEGATGDTDAVVASVDWVLAAKQQVEVLRTRAPAGTESIDLAGNELRNAVTGNAGVNKLKGGGGSDVVTGDGNDDDLWGGSGKDVFNFNAPSDSTVKKSGRDTIFDFSKKDDIDLRTIDANSHKKGDQKFDWIGKDKFTGDEGDVRYEKHKSDTFIYGDINGDKHADFAIHLDDAVTLKAGYFLL